MFCPQARIPLAAARRGGLPRSATLTAWQLSQRHAQRPALLHPLPPLPSPRPIHLQLPRRQLLLLPTSQPACVTHMRHKYPKPLRTHWHGHLFPCCRFPFHLPRSTRSPKIIVAATHERLLCRMHNFWLLSHFLAF